MTNKINLQNQITRHERRLQKLKEQEASFGLHAPPHILTEIEDIETELTDLREQLAALDAVPIDDQMKRDRQYQIALHWAKNGRQGSLARFDLSGRDLAHEDLKGADLRKADLSQANLTWTNLEEADLSGAILRDTILDKSHFLRGKLIGADLRQANLNRITNGSHKEATV